MVAKVLFILFGVLMIVDIIVLMISDEVKEAVKKEELEKSGWLGFALGLIFLISGILAS
jgi:hypothetical protein